MHISGLFIQDTTVTVLYFVRQERKEPIFKDKQRLI